MIVIVSFLATQCKYTHFLKACITTAKRLSEQSLQITSRKDRRRENGIMMK